MYEVWNTRTKLRIGQRTTLTAASQFKDAKERELGYNSTHYKFVPDEPANSEYEVKRQLGHYLKQA